MINPELPGRVGSLNISIPITVGFLAAVVTGGLTFAFHISNIETRKTLEYLSACLGTSIGVTSAFYVGQNIQLNAREKKIDRTIVYIARWSDPGFDSTRKAVYLINEAITRAKIDTPNARDSEVINQKLETDLSLRISVHDALNFLEDLATCIEQGIVDEKLLHCFYRSIVMTYCRTFEVWIQQLRSEKKNPQLFRSLTDLCARWDDSQVRHKR
ncbi:MAG: DUF4760 domain-containing protein [Leptolyngbyaceae cyanobacterium CSU_1_3]|nr:DUF4760 domain-containing protein [Leptolyngbyaceae cyanobacterium CSU_1_3]